jgi:hypothetical protein
MTQNTKDAVPTVPVELSGVAEVLENGDGFWRTCSGCHETEDGYPVGHYPFSAILKCDLGSGCSECGGIGAVWDDTDYDAMAEVWHAEETAREQAEASKDCATTTSEVAQAPAAWQVRRADGRIDGAPIQWENCTEDLYSATLSTGRYAGYENGPRCEVRALYAAPVAPTAEQAEAVRVLTADDADMVWPDYDIETFHHSIDDAVDYEVDQAWPTTGPLELKVQLAKRIPTATIRIFNITENGHEWEILAATAPSTGEQA